MMQFGNVDLSETYFVPASNFFSRSISFTVRRGQDALRVLLARSNAKIALIRESDKKVIDLSKPIEGGKAQLLAVTDLQDGTKYQIVIELSEKAGIQDGEALSFCEHFTMQIKTWESSKVCYNSGGQVNGVEYVETKYTIGSDPTPQTVTLSKKVEKLTMNLVGQGFSDLFITIDYSDAFFKTDLIVRTTTGEQTTGVSDDGDAPDQD